MPHAHMKRMACQIAAQLPDDPEEALGVLNYVKEIVLNLGGGWGGVRPTSAQLYSVPRPQGPEGSTTGEKVNPTCRPDKASLG